jgi:hypothetical protein
VTPVRLVLWDQPVLKACKVTPVQQVRLARKVFKEPRARLVQRAQPVLKALKVLQALLVRQVLRELLVLPRQS